MSPSEESDSNKIRVLFIDDETDITEQAKIFLEKADARLAVETATSAEEGLELLEQNEFQVLVSDYKMPEMDGLELLKTLRDRDNEIPFIILTGKGREEAAMKALNLGADRYFQKGGEPKSQYSVLADAIMQVAEHYWIKERNEFLNSLLSRDLRKKIDDINGQLEKLKKLKIPKEGREILETALREAQEGANLIDKVNTIRESEREEEAEKVNLDVLNTFLGYAWSESQLMLSRLWRSYKKVSEHNEVLFDLAKNSAEHKSLLEKINSNLGDLDMKQYEEPTDEDEFQLQGQGDEEILDSLLEKEKLVLDIYKKLISLTDKSLIERSWKGENPDAYFDTLERLISETKNHIKQLEKTKRYIAFGVPPPNKKR